MRGQVIFVAVLTALCLSVGGASVRAFMEMMIKHHSKAVKEAEQCLERAEHSEMRSLCQNIITTQTAEIQQLETWLCQWYGECQSHA